MIHTSQRGRRGLGDFKLGLGVFRRGSTDGKGMDLLLSKENSITHWGGESQTQSQITANKGQNVIMSNECF